MTSMMTSTIKRGPTGSGPCEKEEGTVRSPKDMNPTCEEEEYELLTVEDPTIEAAEARAANHNPREDNADEEIDRGSVPDILVNLAELLADTKRSLARFLPDKSDGASSNSLDVLDGCVTCIKEAAGDVKRETSDKTAEIQRLVDGIQSLQAEKRRLEGEVVKLKKAYDDITKNADEAIVNEMESEAKVKELEAQLSEMKQQLHEKMVAEAKVGALERQLEISAESTAHLIAQLSEKDSQLSEKDSRLSEKDEEIERLKRTLEAVQHRFGAQITRQRKEISKQRRMAEEAIANASSEVARAQSAAVGDLGDVKADSSKLEEANRNMNEPLNSRIQPPSRTSRKVTTREASTPKRSGKSVSGSARKKSRNSGRSPLLERSGNTLNTKPKSWAR